MKNIRLSILAVLAILASACQSDSQKITTAAQGYLDAMGNYKPSEARPFATEQTCQSTLAFYEKIMENVDPSIYANNIPATITLGEMVIDDTIATVAYHKSTPTVEQDGNLTLVKRNKTWLVSEVINVPAVLNPNVKKESHKFSDEEIAEMRKNGAHSDSTFTPSNK